MGWAWYQSLATVSASDFGSQLPPPILSKLPLKFLGGAHVLSPTPSAHGARGRQVAEPATVARALHGAQIRRPPSQRGANPADDLKTNETKENGKWTTDNKRIINV